MISVAMATYNGEEYIYEQLKSILSQTISVDEIIICDDKSTDDTVKIIKSFHDNRIKLKVNDSNLGYKKNFYQAISMTNGDYIFLSDQDDIWFLNKVKKMIDIIKKRNCDLLCSNFELIDKDGLVIGNKNQYNVAALVKKTHKNDLVNISFDRLLLGNVLQGCTYCFTKKIKNKYVAINNTEVVHDWQLCLIAAYVGKVLFYGCPLIRYRLHGNNSVGFKGKDEKIQLDLKKPKRVPTMVVFFKDFNKIVRLSVLAKIRILIVFYFRVPKLIAELRLPI